MRIIGGDARGRTIVAPAGAKTRPTQDYVRESLFNIIRWDVEDAPGARPVCGHGCAVAGGAQPGRKKRCAGGYGQGGGRGHPQKHGNFAS